MTCVDEGRNVHSGDPSRAYERIALVPLMTISVRNSFFQMNGVAQFVSFGRSVRQITLPVAESSAVRVDDSSLSLTKYTRPSCTTGDAAVPHPKRVGLASSGTDQIALPLKSKA